MSRRYRRMLKGMARLKKSKKVAYEDEDPWILYILECADGSFYTGITKDLNLRLKKHNDGKGAAYTRTHKPVRLIYQEPCADRTSALIRELKIKSLSRPEKEKLISNFS